jgi:hypothetical protein
MCNMQSLQFGVQTVRRNGGKVQDMLKMEGAHSSKCQKPHVTLQSVITTCHTTVCLNHMSHYNLS